MREGAELVERAKHAKVYDRNSPQLFWLLEMMVLGTAGDTGG